MSVDDVRQKRGAFLQAARKAASLGQKEVAHALGTDRYQTVSDWERGEREPALDEAVAMCRLYGVEMADYIAAGEHGASIRLDGTNLRLAAIRKIADGTAPDEIVRTLVEGSSRPSGDDGRETADRVREALDSVRPAARRKKEA